MVHGLTQGLVEADDSLVLKTVLLVDDRENSRVTTKWFLANFGFAVESAGSAEEGLALFDRNLHDLVVTDNSMPGMSGAEMAHIIKLRSASTPVIMYTGAPPQDCTCVDSVVPRSTGILALKEAVDSLLASSQPALKPATKPRQPRAKRRPRAERE